MPLIEPDPNYQPDIRMPTGTGMPYTRVPTAGETLAAAFLKDNPVVSLVKRLYEGTYPADAAHNPLDTIGRGSIYEQHYLDRFLPSQSEAETRATMRRIDGELENNRILAASGSAGVIASLAAGLLDPTIFLPAGAVVKAGREGYSVARSALSIGLAAGAQAATQESILQGTQETRSPAESGMAVGSATLLGAILGSGAARLLSRAERSALEKSLDETRVEAEAHVTGRTVEDVRAATPQETAFAPAAQAAGAAATDTRKIELVSAGIDKLPLVGALSQKLDPMTRMMTSQSVSARRAAVDLAETPLRIKENLEGVPTTSGPALDRIARLNINQTRVAVSDELERLFAEYRFGDPDTTVPRLRSQFEQFMGRDAGYMSFGDFKREVSRAIMSDGRHDIPQVQQAAQTIRSRVFDQWAPRAEAAIEEFQPLTPKEGEGYFPHMWDKEKIAARRPEFVNKLLDLYKADQATKAAGKDRLVGLSRQLSDTQKRIEKLAGKDDKDKIDELIEATARHDRLRNRIEEELMAWEGKSSKEAKSAIKARERYAAETGRGDGEPRLKSADEAVDRVVKRIVASDRDISDAELRDRAHQTVERILGSPDGRLPYDMHMGGPEVGWKGGESQRGSLHDRAFDVSNEWARDWIETDIEEVVNTYLRTVVPDTLIAERFGDVRMTESFRKIEDDFAKITDTTKNESERKRLNTERETALRDLAGIRDRIRGVYGFPVFAAMPNAARIAAATKNFNVLASMGMATISSLPDMAGAVFRHGLGNVFRDAWAPFARSIMGDSIAWKEAARQFRAMGIAIESFSAQRHHEMADILDSYKPQSRFERALQWGADKFMMANLLGPWTDFGKVNASIVTSAEILRAARAVTEGKATQRQITNLAESGIDRQMAERVWKEFQTGGEVQDGVYLPNTADWTDRQAREAFEGAVAREVDISIVTPGQEKPLWLSNPVISVLGQFKSFVAAAHQRILIANLQRRDAQVLQGLVASMALGMLSYKINAVLGGQPVSDRPQDWFKESISRSGLLGWIEEGNAMAAKMTRGGADVYRLIGADKPLSRYAGRTVLDQVLGPTAGKVESLAKVTGAATTGDWQESDTKALRRLVALQNLFYLRNLFDEMERQGNGAFGIEMKDAATSR